MATPRRQGPYSLPRVAFAALLGALILALLVGAAASPPAGHAAFPGVNGKIAFESHRDGNAEVYVMSPDGSMQTNLTNNPASDSAPTWSPDGTKIAFQSDRSGTMQIWKMDFNGSNPMQVTNDPVTAFSPTWSADGTRIAFVSTRNGGFNAHDIFVINEDGTGEAPLATTAGVQETSPAWAPDDSKIVYNRHTFFANNELFTMNPDGSGQALLPPSLLPQGIQRSTPGWSPDAQKVVFQGDRPGQGHQIFTTNADGSGGVTEVTAGSPLSNNNPAFAPDGTRIVFSSSRDGNQEIYVMNANGTGQTRLTLNAAFDHDPDWQPLVNLPPATVTLSPLADVNPVGTSHTVTATVTDALGRPVEGVIVRFTTTGSATRSGSCTTNAAGQCSFTYTGPALPGADLIRACADVDGDGVADPEEPCGEATKAWLLPDTTAGQVTGGGQVPGTSDDVAFGFNAKSTTSGLKGNCSVVDPATDTHVKCLDVTALVRSGTHATFFGNATVNGAATTYRIDVDDLSESGAGQDTFTIQTASYTAGGVLTHGNVQIHK